MKKMIMLIFAAIAISTLTNSYQVQANAETNANIKAPSASPALRACIKEYRKENYIGALQGLRAIVKQNKNDFYAKYYMALCYTQLGYKKQAEDLYKQVSDNSKNLALIHYSKLAVTCLNNPTSAECSAAPAVEGEQKQEVVVDDMTQFIQSGKQFHPSVTDRITNERMKREVEKKEYEKKQLDQLKSQGEAPTNEEIAAALNTLSKIGFNPFQYQNQQSLLGLNSNEDLYNAMFSKNLNPETAKMLLYTQMLDPKNNLMNFGI